MPLIDYGRYSFDPWARYDKDRDYLLRKASFDEDVKARKQRAELATQQAELSERRLGLEEQQFAEQKKMNKVQREDIALKRRQEAVNGFMAKFDVMANVIHKTTPRNYNRVREYLFSINEPIIRMSTKTDEEANKAIEELNKIIPAEYDPDFVESALSLYDKEAEKLDIDSVWITDGKTERVVPYEKKKGFEIPEGWQKISSYEAEQKRTHELLKSGSTFGQNKWTALTKDQKLEHTRKYYNDTIDSYKDPEDPRFIRTGPADDPDKYVRLTNEVKEQRDADYRRIEKGEQPSFLTGETEPKQELELPEGVTEEQINATIENQKLKGRTVTRKQIIEAINKKRAESNK